MLLCSLLIFLKINFFENSFTNTIRVSNSLDPDRINLMQVKFQHSSWSLSRTWWETQKTGGRGVGGGIAAHILPKPADLS